VIELVILDVWAQALPTSTTTFTAPGEEPIVLADSLAVSGPLCGQASFQVSVTAEDHAPFVAELTYEGVPETGSLSVVPWGDEAAWSLTSDLRETAQGPVRHYTLWVGLVHRWFAPTGRPARRGNDVTLLANGEEANVQIYTDMLQATSSITASTWWWQSDFELVRDPATHIWLEPVERWGNTLLGLMGEKGIEGVESKILVNQFFSQDGMLSSVTYDGWLVSAAETPADGIEFMGQANEISGQFQVEIGWVDFAERLAWAWVMPEGYEILENVSVAPPMGPYDVDMSDVPLGLSLLDIPHASWHQKFVTVDHQVAIVGGMNVKSTDWDTSDHPLYGWRRMEFEATADERWEVFTKESHSDTEPRRDYMLRIEGPLVADLESVFAWRWQTLLAWDVYYAQYASDFQLGAVPAPMPGGIQAQVLTTMPPPWHEMGIADSLLRAIDQAQHYILVEDQHFRSPILAERIASRMIEEPDLELIVVTNEVSEWTDPGCWQTAIEATYFESLFPNRFHLFTLRTYDAHDVGCFLCLDEVLGEIERVFIHSKIVLIDDVWALMGSTNHSNRGLLFEGEMSIAIFDAGWVRQARDAIVLQLLGPWFGGPGLPMAALADAFEDTASWNQNVYDLWDDEGWDLDLDGDPVPAQYIPDGFLYRLKPIDPDACLLEEIGPDVM
jgi:phosphatidylserine/phosphatidylglycerophosphate/cardiolipin synthase-like enzyme